MNRFLLPPEPIILHYTLNPAIPPPEKPAAWDVEVKLDDSSLKARMQHVVMSMASDSAKELTKLGAVIQVPFRSGNQFLGEGGLQVRFLRYSGRVGCGLIGVAIVGRVLWY